MSEQGDKLNLKSEISAILVQSCSKAFSVKAIIKKVHNFLHTFLLLKNPFL